jgi:hypothetical protein
MAIDTTGRRSRRAILAGGLGGVAALAAGAFGRPSPALAGTDGDVVLGGENVTSGNTHVTNSDVGGSAVGFTGSCYAGTGLYGTSHTSYGAYGYSDTHVGSFGVGAVAGVAGQNGAGTGVLGYGGFGDLPAPKPSTGVYGYAAQDANSRGVWGYSPAGQGVRGDATTGRGVNGQASSGLGVRGFATSGVGLSGEAATGYALRTMGRVRLDNSAGRATIASGAASVMVTPGIDLTSTSAVVATLNGDAGGSTAVKRVAIDTAANTFTIYLTANATVLTKVAWIVLG